MKAAQVREPMIPCNTKSQNARISRALSRNATPRECAKSCATACALACALIFQGCATKAPPPEAPVQQAKTSYVYVLAPASLMLHMDASNPPLLSGEGLPENLPVFPTREAARKWLDNEVREDRIIPGLWRIFRLEASWATDVVTQDDGASRMRRAARVYPLL